MKQLTIIFLLTALCIASKAQKVQEMNFDTFEPMLEQTNDTVYVINFWATWCKPCIEELPHFIKVANEMKNQKVKFVFVSLDFPKQKDSRLIPYIKKNKIKEQVILLNDPNANVWINKVNPKWSGAIPATVIYKKTDRYFIEGQLSYEELITTIKSKQP